ncbi:PREDICTED: PRAME family member 20-like [Chinchilla lanigera]|uniref:PRAME family member 20-like n=1 Tax=Chinchilla lanigera TaxID=34839 RepID=UPI0006963563|nr:PREDICTED: PRAME family member 20-like [Chinchilla lanigera]
MSTQSANLLRNLAIQSLLRDKTLTMEALEELPGEVFPALFMEAFTMGHAEVLKAMVLSWPFPCLPLGGLISLRNAETLDSQEDDAQMLERMFLTIMDGLDVLLRQKVRSRKLKLQVLDMRVKHQNFWRVWARNELQVCSEEAEKKKTEEPGSRGTKKQPFKVILDLWLSQGFLCVVEAFLINWALEREDVVQLDCKNLRITNACFPTAKDFLELLTLDSVQEVLVGQGWTLFTLAQFAPFLGQMQNLHRLILCDISLPAIHSAGKREQLFTQIASQFRNLRCLQQIYVDSVNLLEDRLDRVLRCLPTPLETLSLTHCQLSHSDWIQLPQAEQTRHLEVLVLSCIPMTDFSPEPLQILLKNVAATLTTLHLENCGITDAQVCAFLPSLSCCSQLTAFCFARNFVSTDTMRKLLCHTARLSNLILEVYSAPPDLCFASHGVDPHLRNQELEDLRRILKPINHPRTVYFCTFHCERCCHWKVYNMHPPPCPDCIPI